MPNLSIYDELGNEYKLKDFQGNVLVIYFWASWRLDSIEFLQKLSSMKERLLYDDIKNIEILPISIDFKEIESLLSLYDEKKIKNLPFFIDSNRKFASSINVDIAPCLLVIGKNLVEISRNYEDFDIEELQEEILNLTLNSK